MFFLEVQSVGYIAIFEVVAYKIGFAFQPEIRSVLSVTH